MIRKILALALAATAFSVASAPGAEASFGIAPETLGVTLSTIQAGAHADLTTTFMMNTRPGTPEGEPTEVDGNLREVQVQMPAGLTGNATAIARCEPALMFTAESCPASSQVGVSTVYNNVFGSPFPVGAPVFNLVPQKGHTAEFGFRMLIAQQLMVVRVRPGDGGLETRLSSISEGIQLAGASMTLWGVPGSHAHDAQRGSNYTCYGEFCFGGGELSTVPAKPFLTNPTQCTGQPLEAQFRLRSWQEPDTFVDYSAPMGTITGCDKLHFDPEITVRPSTRSVDTPTGLTTDLTIPQNENTEGLATANLRRAEVTLPEGMTLNPSVANGLASCSDEQLGLGNADDPACPPASIVGTATVHTPALPDQLSGKVYVRSQVAGDPYRLAMVLQGDGITLKIPGSAHADPVSGQLTAVFDDTPQQPFSELELTLDGGPQAPLVLPASCGTATTTGALTPWSAPESGGPAELSDSFEVRWDEDGAACPDRLPFSPGFSAGVTNPVAGAFSPFVLGVTREDRQQMLSSIDGVHLPKGLMADIGSVPLCPSDQAAAGSCGAASQIGRVLASAGAGPSPVQVQGRVYLTEGYKGAPFGLSIVVPAVAGPFDLGTVVTRASLRVDPRTAEVAAEADPLPTILEGVPLRLRDVGIELDRPDFAVNPTSCEEMQVGADLGSTEGTKASLADRFQVSDCAALGFKPKLSMSFTGATHRSAHPAVRAVLKARKGDANIGRAVVTLPKTEFLENAHLENVCTRVRYAAGTCPKNSVYGYAKAWSPLLDEPLKGPVYLRSSNHQLPDLVASLDGQIHLDLAGKIDSVNERMRTTFWAVPDAPVSKFVLNMKGGDHGLLVNNTELCQAKPRLSAAFTGHNGKRSRSIPLVKVGCGKH